MKNSISNTNRIIAFDLLRAIMIILLIFFHCGVSFMDSSVDPEIWTYKSSQTSILFDGFLGFIHTFRHPTFFIISGFVSEMMYKKYSANQVIKKRVDRLFIPFAIVVLLFSHLVHFLLDYLEFSTLNYQFILDSSFVWFLYYLIIYSVFHYLYHKLFSQQYQQKTNRFHVISVSILVYFLTSFILSIWGENSFFGVYSFLPDLGSILGYSLFYILGVYLFKNNDVFYQLKKQGWIFIISGFIALLIYYIVSFIQIQNQANTFDFNWELMLSYNFSAVFISLGGIGLALKYYRKPLPFITYLSKSSYFLYLIHFPFVLLFLILVSETEINVFAQFIAVFCLTLLTSFGLNAIWRKAWKNNPPI